MSSHILLDAHIQVAPDISVSEGHQINEYAMQRLREKEPDLRDITLHIDHESDDLKCNWQLALLRPEIEQHIQSKSALAGYESVTIHYDHQFIRVDLVYNKMPDDRMKTACKALVSETNWLLSAKLYYSSFTEEIGLDEKIQQTSPGNTS